MVVTHIHAKDDGQRSVTLKRRVEMDRRMDRGDCITSRANTVSNYYWLLG